MKNVSIDSGKCGENLAWSLTGEESNYTLTIYGEREMDNFYPSDDIPWMKYAASIKTVEISSGVTSIGNYAFYGCRSLTAITVPDAVTHIGSYAFADCCNLVSINVPNSVSAIECGAFENCHGLTSITIPNSVTSIESIVFCNCSNLVSIDIPDSVISINGSAFEKCSSLVSITIPNSVGYIENLAFCGCNSLINIFVDVNNTVYSDDSGVLFNKNKTKLIRFPSGRSGSYVVPASVTHIEDSAFHGCNNLSDIFVDANNTVYSSDDSGTLYSKNKTELIRVPAKKNGIYTIPITVTAIRDSAFSNCSGLTSVIIPDSVTAIRDSVFSDCSGLTSVIIPNSVTSIGWRAFSGCSGLRSITIPTSVASIEWGAFYGCCSLTSLYVCAKKPVDCIDIFSDVNKECTLYVPQGTAFAYRASTGWKNFVHIMAMYDDYCSKNNEDKK